MKSPRSSRRTRTGTGGNRTVKKPVGTAAGTGHNPTVFINARTPSVPSSLELSLEEYYAASALMGLLAAQTEEPEHKWACAWAHRLGREMAMEAIRHRRKQQK